MKLIKNTLAKEFPSLTELINCFETVKENGDVGVIKFDGEREEKGYTVFITFSSSKKREMIRADEDQLEKALIKVLNKYVEES